MAGLAGRAGAHARGAGQCGDLQRRTLADHLAYNAPICVGDSSFRAALWHQARIADPGLLARTPCDPWPLARLGTYSLHDGVHRLAALDYAFGLSKVSNRERFVRDARDGRLIGHALVAGMAVRVLRLPVPVPCYRKLPGEAGPDRARRGAAGARPVAQG